MLQTAFVGNPTKSFSIDVSFTNVSFFAFLVLMICLCYFVNVFTPPFFVNVVSFIGDLFTSFCDMLLSSVRKFPFRFTSFLVSIVTYIVMFNVLGLIPYSYTVTSQLSISLFFSSIVWFGKLYLGFAVNGRGVFSLLLPAGLPFGMVGFFVLVESIGFMIPLFSLGVRLFANLMSGHILLKVIFGFSFAMVSWFSLFGYISHLVILVVLLFLYVLEFGVALIQGYVFGLLLTVYLGELLLVSWFGQRIILWVLVVAI